MISVFDPKRFGRVAGSSVRAGPHSPPGFQINAPAEKTVERKHQAAFHPLGRISLYASTPSGIPATSGPPIRPTLLRTRPVAVNQRQTGRPGWVVLQTDRHDGLSHAGKGRNAITLPAHGRR
jgi:hypothetical protein